MLDKSFCAKPDKRVWPTTFVVVQTHPSLLPKFAYSYFVVFSPVRKQKTEIFHSAYFALSDLFFFLDLILVYQ